MGEAVPKTVVTAESGKLRIAVLFPLILPRDAQCAKSTTLGDLEWPLRTLFQDTCVFGAQHE